MDTKELHAYIHGPDFTAVTKWIEAIVTDVERKETFDMIEEIGVIMLRFDGKHDLLLLEQLVDTGWLELTIRPKAPDSIFAVWEDIQLGECIVDDLGGITLVDCGGKYVDPLAPFKVRISIDKMELVELPLEIGDPFDEERTQLIKRREKAT
jgi:hypothetical protein